MRLLLPMAGLLAAAFTHQAAAATPASWNSIADLYAAHPTLAASKPGALVLDANSRVAQVASGQDQAEEGSSDNIFAQKGTWIGVGAGVLVGAGAGYGVSEATNDDDNNKDEDVQGVYCAKTTNQYGVNFYEGEFAFTQVSDFEPELTEAAAVGSRVTTGRGSWTLSEAVGNDCNGNGIFDTSERVLFRDGGGWTKTEVISEITTNDDGKRTVRFERNSASVRLVSDVGGVPITFIGQFGDETITYTYPYVLNIGNITCAPAGTVAGTGDFRLTKGGCSN